MNGYEEEKPHCYFHPTEIVVGICGLCLRDRLLNLASTQGQQLSSPEDDDDDDDDDDNHAAQLRSNRIQQAKKKHTLTPATFPKVFAFSYFLRGHRRRRSSCSSDVERSNSHEDSFISIKFEEDGQASWTHKTSSGISSEPFKLHLYDDEDGDEEAKRPQSLVEYVKKQPKASGWRKRISQLFHLMRLKRWSPRAKGSLALAGGGKAKVDYAKHRNCFKLGR